MDLRERSGVTPKDWLRVLKVVRRVNSRYEFAHIRYGRSKTLWRGLRSACLSVGERGRRTVRILKNYGGGTLSTASERSVLDF